MSVPIAFVEDDKAFLDTLKAVFGGDPKFNVVGAFTAVGTAIEGIPKLQPPPAIVLMDLNFPVGSGIEATAKLKTAMPDLLIVVLTVVHESDKLFQALSAGADGYLLKRTSPAGIVAAVEEVLAGGSPMSASIARRVLKHFTSNELSKGFAALVTLTTAELRVLAHYATHGGTTDEMSAALNLSKHTISTHFRNILKRLQVHERSKAAHIYRVNQQRGSAE